MHQATRPTPQPPAAGITRPARNAPTGQPRPSGPGSILRLLTRPPRVGTLVQRSSAMNKKIACLMATPPPPPRRPRQLRPNRPPVSKSRVQALFGDTLSDLSDDDQPRTNKRMDTTPQQATPTQIAASKQPGQKPVPRPKEHNAAASRLDANCHQPTTGPRTSTTVQPINAADRGQPGPWNNSKRATLCCACLPAVQGTGGQTPLYTSF